jgi:hypothetical protein
MTTISPTLKTPADAAASAITGTPFHAAVRWRPAAFSQGLMPYEAAAKAIFVKANGLAAYYQTTGIARYVR